MQTAFSKTLSIALAVAAFLTVAPAASAQVVPSYQNGFKSADGDTLDFSTTNGQARRIQVCLRSDVAWWKGVKIFGLPGGEFGIVETQDNNKGPSCATFDEGEFAPNYTKIELMKAKALGAHTGIQTLKFDPRNYSGKTLNVRWRTD